MLNLRLHFQLSEFWTLVQILDGSASSRDPRRDHCDPRPFTSRFFFSRCFCLRSPGLSLPSQRANLLRNVRLAVLESLPQRSTHVGNGDSGKPPRPPRLFLGEEERLS